MNRLIVTQITDPTFSFVVFLHSYVAWEKEEWGRLAGQEICYFSLQGKEREVFLFNIWWSLLKCPKVVGSSGRGWSCFLVYPHTPPSAAATAFCSICMDVKPLLFFLWEKNKFVVSLLVVGECFSFSYLVGKREEKGDGIGASISSFPITKMEPLLLFLIFPWVGVAHKPAVTLLDEWALVSPVVSPIDFLFNDSSNKHLEHRQRPAHLIPLVSVDDLFVWKVFFLFRFFLFPFSGTSRVNRPGSRRFTIREPPNGKKGKVSG